MQMTAIWRPIYLILGYPFRFLEEKDWYRYSAVHGDCLFWVRLAAAFTLLQAFVRCAELFSEQEASCHVESIASLSATLCDKSSWRLAFIGLCSCFAHLINEL